MRAAQYKLTLSDVAEACSIGMAPTTSTVLTLGLGDALAVALMEQRKFSRDHFRTFHPGGTIGCAIGDRGATYASCNVGAACSVECKRL